MSYLSRIPIIGLKHDYFKSFYSVCPCKRIAECSSKLYFVRSQSTAPKTSARLIKKMRPKKNVYKKQYADVIKVGNADGEMTQQEFKIVKKTSMKDILKEMDSLTNKAKTREKLKASSSTHLPQTAAGLRFNNNSDKIQMNNNQQRRLTTTVNSSEDAISLESADASKHESLNVLFNNQPLSSSQFHNYDESQALSALDEVTEFQDEITEASNPNVKSGRLSKKQQEKIHKKQHTETMKNAFMFYHNITLAAYLDVCINCNMMNQAYSVLLASRKRGGKNAETLPINVFNLLVTAYARRGNWSRVKDLLFLMREDKIQPNLQTYAGLIYCAGKRPKPDLEIISNLLKDCEKDGLDIRHLDNSCVFIDDQRERVINTILKVKPEFSLIPITNMEPYDNTLLTSLRNPIDRYQSLGVGSSTEKDLKSNVSHQMQTEVDGYINIKSIQNLSSEIGSRTDKMRQLLQKCESNWELALTNRFTSSLKALSKEMNRGINTKNVNLLPFLSVLKVEEYVKIMVKEIRDLAENSETYSLPITTLQHNLGRKVMNIYFVKTKEKNRIVDKILRIYRKYCHYQLSSDLQALENPREHWIRHLQTLSKGPSINIQEVIWPGNILTAVGKFMYDILLQEVTFDTNLIRNSNDSAILKGKVPAFYNIYRNQKVKLIEEVKPHPFLVRLFNMAAKETITFETNIIPMLVPPLPWTSTKCGGYLLSSVPLVRLTSHAQLQLTRMSDAPVKQLWPIFDSLNQLGECAWKINQPILDLLINVFNNNGDESLDIPSPPTTLTDFPVLHSDMSKEEKAKVYKDRIWFKRKRAEMYSLWCDSLYRLSIANKFRDKTFWFPHNLDFRGRVYPCPPHFNHLGGDVARSLLLFDKAEPLGEKGLDWLKIHLINLTGLKKRDSLEERLKYANDMMPEIIDSAFNPLTGNRWWANSEEPWQTLACCKEIIKATVAPDPTKYLCHFPIHQDGSCNGLQHYSALGRDELGARQVNLHPSDRPQDVYAGIAQLIEKERAKDAAAGLEIAKHLEGFVQRKVIKQTVMTTVYGVTRYGARLQILKQLKAMPNFPMDKHWGASLYLVDRTFQSLQQMFTATKEIQDWFTESARLVSHVCGQSVEWVTPLGLPVVQPYHRDSKQSFTFGSKHRVSVQSIDIYQKPNVTKQKNAFPPNYIHSLDSTHMMLTSLYCRRKGIAFVSVHDCFWTHPSTVEIMNHICREQFVALHDLKLLHELSKFFTEKYSYRENELFNDGSVEDATKKKLNKLLKRVPKTGKFQLKEVLNSTYFFS